MTEGLDIKRLLWMLYMQPLRLHYILINFGIPEPDGSAISIFRSAEAPARTYVIRMTILLWTLCLTGALVITASLNGIGSLRQTLIPMVLLGGLGAAATGSLVALFVGVVLGFGIATSLSITLTSTIGLFLAIGANTVPGSSQSVIVGVTAGLITGLALDAIRGVSTGEPRSILAITSSSILGGAAYGIVLKLVLGAFDPLQATRAGTFAGSAFGLLLFLTSSRLLFYPIESTFQLALYALQLWGRVRTLHIAPVLYHDLSRLPYPGLFRHLLLGLEADPNLADRVRDACREAPGQRSIAARLLPYLQARQIEALVQSRNYSGLLRLRGDFLPGVGGATPWQLTLSETARYLQAAMATTTPYLRLQHLHNAKETLSTLETQSLLGDPSLVKVLQRPVLALRTAMNQGRSEAEAEAVHQLPNPFRAGDPLTPEQGRELFRGRESLVRQIEQLLADPGQSFSLALLGPRRCGKTSLLRMLPVLLPDVFCLFFDLQDNPVDSPANFFQALAERGREQAQRDRRIEIPPLPPGSPFEAGREWIAKLEQLGERHRILLCFDEFETLESTFPGDGRDLVRLMGLLRGTIQHRRHVRLLISGTAPFDELSPLWNDYFINLRELQIGHLEKPRAIELLTHPVAEFPRDAVPPEVAAAIFYRTGGQPFLLQLYGSLLISRLNEQGRRQAAESDLNPLDDEVLTTGRSYFANTLERTPREARLALVALASDNLLHISQRSRAWLRRRSLIDDQDSLRIPIFGTWIREEGEEIFAK